MSEQESEEQYEEDFFGNAFKFLDLPKEREKGENEGETTERKKFKIGDYSKENRPESPRVLAPEHPLLEKFQKALTEHLLKQIEQMNEDVFQLETSTKKLEVEREKLGIETYEAQQIVCKEQKLIEEYLEEIENVSNANQELDHHIEELSVTYTEERQKLFEAERKELELRNELESVNLLLQKVSCWEKDVETDLKTNQRISEKTKKEKIQLAAEKRELDMIIYRLMTEVWRLENEVETMDMQLRVKEEEKERIAVAVALSGTDIEALESENKCLLQSWNSVVNAICNRDKTLTSLQNDLRTVNENIKSTISEIEQIKKIIKKEWLQNETLIMFKNRVIADLKNCNNLLNAEKVKRVEIEKKFMELQNIYDATDRNIMLVKGETAKKEIEYNQLMTDFEKMSREKVQLEEKILLLLQDQITNDKAGLYLKKLVRQVKEKNRDMQITLTTVENTNAKTMMDIEAQKFINENSMRLIDELQKKQDEYNAEIKKITTETDKLQFIMHRKQREFDILNKHYDTAVKKLASNSGTSNEEKMRDLEKQIEEIELKIKNLQKYWLREQENMVILTKDRQEQIKDNNLLKKQVLILEQKNLKLADDLEALKKQDEKMNRSITSLLSKQTQLQDEFNKKKGNKEDIGKENNLMQSEYLCQLEDAEMQAIKLQSDLEEIEENKGNLSKDLIEKNREALAWEKKWQLATETKENMKKEQSSEGEIGHMKAEIHRMTVRYSQLKKAQDKLIVDLEQCVSRRDAIATVAEAREKRGTYNRPQKINYVRKLDDVRNKIKKVQMEIEEVDTDIENAKIREQELKDDIKNTESQTYDLDDEIEKTKDDIEVATTDKQQMLEMLILKQRKLQMLNDIARKRPIKYLFKDEALLEMEYLRQKDINDKLISIANNLMTDYPDLTQEFLRITNTLKLAAESCTF